MTAETETIAREMLDALRGHRADAAVHWVMGAQQWGFVGTFPELVAEHGMPEHIAKLDDLIARADAAFAD